MLHRELMIFFNAVMFLTRIRVPSFVQHQPEYLQQTPRYYPLTGMIVGIIAALVFLVVNKYISPNAAILAYMISGIWTTGAFHEDGFADVCDAFGGGWTKEKILLIMKDSRLGTYGVVGLIGILSAKFILLKELPVFQPTGFSGTQNIFSNYAFITGCFLAAHACSRFMPLLGLQFFEYVSDPDQSKSKPMANRKPGMANLFMAFATALLPFLLMGWLYLWILLPMLLASWQMNVYFRKWIGGYTGDCLGAIQQVTEIIFYLGVLITWKYFI